MLAKETTELGRVDEDADQSHRPPIRVQEVDKEGSISAGEEVGYDEFCATEQDDHFWNDELWTGNDVEEVQVEEPMHANDVIDITCDDARNPFIELYNKSIQPSFDTI